MVPAHQVYQFPTVEPTSFRILYPNLTSQPWVSFELSDGSKTAEISLSKEILQQLAAFLEGKEN